MGHFQGYCHFLSFWDPQFEPQQGAHAADVISIVNKGHCSHSSLKILISFIHFTKYFLRHFHLHQTNATIWKYLLILLLLLLLLSSCTEQLKYNLPHLNFFSVPYTWPEVWSFILIICNVNFLCNNNNWNEKGLFSELKHSKNKGNVLHIRWTIPLKRKNWNKGSIIL